MTVPGKPDQKLMVQEMIKEKNNLDATFVNAKKVLAEAIEKIQKGGKKDGKSGDYFKYTDIMTPNREKIIVRVKIPHQQHPKYNFVGKLLGPKGSNLKQLQADTGTRMAICGRNSMKDKAKEEQLRKSGNPKHSHLNAELHVMVEAYCTAAESFSRMGYALEEVKKFLIPVLFDPNEMLPDQPMDTGMADGSPSRGGRGRGRGGPGRGMVRPLGAGPPARTPPGTRGGPRGSPRGRGIPGRGRAPPMSLAYQSQEEYYEEPYGDSYESAYETGYEETGVASNGSYGYEDESGGAEYGDYSRAGYGSPSGARGGATGYGSRGSSWRGGSGRGIQRFKSPSQGYTSKAARSRPYTRY